MIDGVIRICGACGTKNRVPGKHLASIGHCGRCKANLPSLAEPLDADQAVFDHVIAAAPVPVLVDFWAPWCPPCRMAAPKVKKVASDMAGKAIVLKVNTEDHPDLAARYDVRGIPNFVVLKNGHIVSQQAGLVGDAEMKRWLDHAAGV